MQDKQKDDRSERLLRTITEAADELRVGRTTIYELIKTKQITAVKIGRCTRVPASALARFVEALQMQGVAAGDGNG